METFSFFLHVPLALVRVCAALRFVHQPEARLALQASHGLIKLDVTGANTVGKEKLIIITRLHQTYSRAAEQTVHRPSVAAIFPAATADRKHRKPPPRATTCVNVSESLPVPTLSLLAKGRGCVSGGNAIPFQTRIERPVIPMTI